MPVQYNRSLKALSIYIMLTPKHDKKDFKAVFIKTFVI